MLDYHDIHRCFPPYGGADRVLKDENGYPVLLIWRALMVWTFEQWKVPNQFDQKLDWKAGVNRKAAEPMPSCLRTYGSAAGKGMTHYRVAVTPFGVSPSTPFRVATPDGKRAISATIQDIKEADGTATTALVLQAEEAVPWATPSSLKFDPDGPQPRLGFVYAGTSPMCMADATVRIVSEDIDPKVLKALLTYNGLGGTGGEPLKGISLVEIANRDGTTYTLMIVQAEQAVPWTKPDPLIFAPEGAPPRLGYFVGGISQAAMADGTVHSIREDISPDVLKALITYNGDEEIPAGTLN